MREDPQMTKALQAYDEKDYKTAFDLWSKLSTINVNAKVNLGTLYIKGQGVKKDMPKAFVLFEEAAKEGHELAAYNLGGMYENGVGIAQDLDKAEAYYEIAADQDNTYAQVKLAMLIQGKDSKKAMKHLIAAAHKNDPQAQELITYVSNAPVATIINNEFRSMDEKDQYALLNIVINTDVAPALAKDEGGIEFVNYVPGEVPEIWLRYLGACSGCHLGSTSTADMIISILEEKIDKKIVLYLW